MPTKFINKFTRSSRLYALSGTHFMKCCSALVSHSLKLRKYYRAGRLSASVKVWGIRNSPLEICE